MAIAQRIVLAAIAGAHGVNGEVRLKLFGEGVESLRRFRAFTLLREVPSGIGGGESREVSPKKLRDDGKGGAILKLAGVELDRKVLADIAMHEGEAFSAIIAQAKAALPAA